MKKLIILSLAFTFVLGSFSSCSRKCKGGGWYGDRNLGYTPKKDKTDEACDIVSIYKEELDCEETAD